MIFSWSVGATSGTINNHVSVRIHGRNLQFELRTYNDHYILTLEFPDKNLYPILATRPAQPKSALNQIILAVSNDLYLLNSFTKTELTQLKIGGGTAQHQLVDFIMRLKLINSAPIGFKLGFSLTIYYAFNISIFCLPYLLHYHVLDFYLMCSALFLCKSKFCNLSNVCLAPYF